MSATRDSGGGGSTSPLTSALQEAQTIVEAARKRAQELQAQADESYKNAYESGYGDGFAQGRHDATAASLRLVHDSVALEDQLAESAARLAISICSFIIGDYLKVSPETIKAIALKTLRQGVIGKGVTIVVHPQDEAVLSQSIDDLRHATKNSSVHIATDINISRGGCIVQTPYGEIDATIETLIDSVAAQLGIPNE